MTQNTVRAGSRGRADVVVMAAMGLFAVAVGAGLYAQIGLAAWLAGALAFAVFAALAGVHAAARRGRTRPATVDGRTRAIGTQRAASRREPESDAPAFLRSGRASASRQPAPRDGQRREDARARTPAVSSATHARSPAAAGQLPATMTHEPGPLTPRSAAEPGVEEALRDYWAYRPVTPRAEERGGSPVTAAVPPALPPSTSPVEPGRTPEAVSNVPEAEVELVQGMVRRLADQVNATAAAPPGGGALGVAMDGAIEASLEALRTTATTMRAASAAASAGPSNPSDPQPQAPSRSPDGAPDAAFQPRLVAIDEALAAGSVDVLLEPVCALGDRQVRHYSVTLRAKTSAGEFASESLESELRNTAALPLLDDLRIARTAQLARKLGERGKKGYVLFDLSATSLVADRLLAGLVAAQRPGGLVCQPVPAFPQSDVREFSGRHWEALRSLRAAGYRFALRGVTHLDMSLDTLKPWGFEFALAGANAFTAGLPRAGGVTAPADACRLLASAGLTLVVTGVDTPETLSKVLGAGAQMGCGALFGGQRLVKAEALAAAQTAAA